MIDRGLIRSEAMARPEVMDLHPEGETFDRKFLINQLAGTVEQVWSTFRTRCRLGQISERYKIGTAYVHLKRFWGLLRCD